MSHLLAGALVLFCAIAAAEPGAKLKVALTFDDLPLNGMLPAGAKKSDFARDTIEVLKKHHIPPSYGFIVAKQLERDPDGAAALQVWVNGGNPLGNHTYTHLDLTKNSAEDFRARNIAQRTRARTVDARRPESGRRPT